MKNKTNMSQHGFTRKPCDHGHRIEITQWKEKEKKKIGRPFFNKLNVE
jgi:hypothetical protein